MDPSSLCSQGVTQSEAGPGNGGLNQGGSGLPFKCSGIDQVRPSLGSQLQKPFVETTNQVQILSQRWRQRLLQRRLQWLRQRQVRLQRLRRLQELLQPQRLQWLPLLQEVLPLLLLPPPPLQEVLQEVLQLLQELQLQPLELQLPQELLEQELQLLEPELQWLEREQQEQRQLLVQDAARLLLAQSRGSSIQASSPKVGVDSQDQEELTMEASTIRSPPINPSPLYSQGVAQSKAGLVNEGGSSFDDINGIESREKLCLNTSLPVDNDFDHSDEMGSDEINLIGSQTPNVKTKSKKRSKSSVWKFYKRITEKDGEERAQCTKCGVKYRIDSKTIGTSTLNRHLKKCPRHETHDVGQLEPKDQGHEPIQEENIIEARTPEHPCVSQGRWSWWIDLGSPASGQLEHKDQGPEPIQEENMIEARTPEHPCVPHAHISSAVQSASGVLGTTPAVTTKRRRLAEMHTESDKSIWSKTSAFRPTSHDSANKYAGTEADEGKSSTPPAATEEVQAPRDLQLSLATTQSGPQEESGSVHKQFASAEELRSIGERKKALKITLNDMLDTLSKGQIESLERYKIAVDVVLYNAGSAVDVKPLEAIFTELFASSKEWQSIQDPASLYQNEVLDRVAILRREVNEERELLKEENSSFSTISKQMKRYETKNFNHKQIILSALDEHKDIDEEYEEQELENEEQSSWIDGYRQMLLEIDESLEHKKIIFEEAIDRQKGFETRAASKEDRLKTFVSKVEGILGVGLESADSEDAAQRYAAHKREAMKAQLQDFSGKINDFFKE